MIDAQLALRVHLGLGFFTMSAFSYIFGRNYIDTTISVNRRFKSGVFLSSFMTMFYYLILNILFNTTNSSLHFLDPVTLRYFCWFLTTPLLLTDILLLEATLSTDIIFVCIIDAIMIISGYIAHIATDPIAIWTMFGFGCLNGIIVIIYMMRYFEKVTFEHRKTMPFRTFLFLSWYTLILWCFFPFIFILFKTNVISYEGEICFYVYLDIFAKGVFGLVLLGARDAIQNHKGRIVRFAKAVISIVPLERTDNSVVPVPPDAEIANMVGTSIPVVTSERTTTTVDDQQDSIISIKNTNLLESPPPRWQ